MRGKKPKVQSHGSSTFGGYTATSPHASATSGNPSKRTIADFLDIGGRDEVDAKMVWFLYACGVPFFAPLIGMIWLKPSTKTLSDTRAPIMRKLELSY